MKPRQALIVAGLLIGFIGIAFFWLSGLKKPPSSKPRSDARLQVLVLESEPGERPLILSGNGRVAPMQTVELTCEVSGGLERGAVPLSQGQRFSKGQLLFTVDARQAHYRLQAEKSKFLSGLARVLADLQLDYPKEYPNWRNYFDSVSLEKPLPALPQVTNSRLRIFLAGQGLLEQYYNTKTQEQEYRKYFVYAPFSGTFTDVRLATGTVVRPGAVVGTIAQTQGLELIVPLPSAGLQQLPAGSKVYILVNGDSLVGQVTRIAPTIDPTTQSQNVYIRPSNEKELISGAYYPVRIVGPKVSGVIEVPRQALIEDRYMFIVRADSSLERREVTVHPSGGNTALVSGLRPGERVVIQSIPDGVPGLKVDPTDPNTKTQNGPKTKAAGAK